MTLMKVQDIHWICFAGQEEMGQPLYNVRTGWQFVAVWHQTLEGTYSLIEHDPIFPSRHSVQYRGLDRFALMVLLRDYEERR